MISVIVVSLNTKNDFEKTIKSIISQTKKVEIIVVDGNSVDGTKDIISKYSNFIDKLIIENDNGIYFAMNKGTKLASYEWVCFLNSGDIFFNKKTIENTINLLKKRNEIDVLIGNSCVNRKKYLVRSPRSFMNKKTVNSCFSHQSTFSKKYLYDHYSFNTEFKYASDFDFFIRLFKDKKKFLYTDQLISINKDGGISDTNKIKVFFEFKKIIIKENKNFMNIFKINILIFFNLIKKIIILILPS